MFIIFIPVIVLSSATTQKGQSLCQTSYHALWSNAEMHLGPPVEKTELLEGERWYDCEKLETPLNVCP